MDKESKIYIVGHCNLVGSALKRELEFNGYIVIQKNVEGVVNYCSGEPISVRRLVETYISEHGANISLNLGYYPYPNYEPMAFWDDTTKLRKIIGGV